MNAETPAIILKHIFHMNLPPQEIKKAKQALQDIMDLNRALTSKVDQLEAQRILNAE